MNPTTTWLKRLRWPINILCAFFVVIAISGHSWGQSLTARQREIVEMVRDYDSSQYSNVWLKANASKLTPEFLADIDNAANEAASARAFPIAIGAKVLVANAKAHFGNLQGSIRAWVEVADFQFAKAESLAEYDDVYLQARDLTNKAAEIGSLEDAAHAAIIAADARFFSTKVDGLKITERNMRLLQSLSDLSEAAPGASNHAKGPAFERFVSLAGEILSMVESTLYFYADSEKRDSLLRYLTLILEACVPIAYRYQYDEGRVSVPQSSGGLASQLAGLSYKFGDAEIAAARLDVAIAWAREQQADDWTAQLILQKYKGERDQRRPSSQLAALRNQIRLVVAEQRNRHVSRVGRIWASSRAEDLLAEVVNDELADKSQDKEEVFKHIEQLKARYLLDQLAAPFTAIENARRKQSISENEATIFSYPQCAHSHRDLRTRESLLVSRYPITYTYLFPEKRDEQKSRLLYIEGLYAEEGAGFQGQASPSSLREVQSALSTDEAIIEYFVPFHPFHPAKDLWIVGITNKDVVVVPVPLEPLENLHREIGGNRIGRTQVGLCPPFDSSPLGDLTAFLRVAIQSSDEQTAQKYLRAFNELLITPLKSAGIDTERHKRWIVVPHGPLHYLPFAALLDDAGKFLIEKVSVTISPSASIWLRKQKQSLGQPKVVLGLFAPKFTNTHSEALASPEQEIKALKAVSQGVTAQLYQDSSATEGKLREYGPKAIIVHLSTHGDFPERNAMDFHEVLLTPEDKDDGRLQAHEIRSLDLSNTALVTLSICNGGLYNVGPGDEPYGLIPAFLASGAKNVVATLFPLEDKFGRDFMTRFYGHLTKDGPATALQETMKSLIKEEELIHRWAAFVNVGPGRLFPLQQ